MSANVKLSEKLSCNFKDVLNEDRLPSKQKGKFLFLVIFYRNLRINTCLNTEKNTTFVLEFLWKGS